MLIRAFIKKSSFRLKMKRQPNTTLDLYTNHLFQINSSYKERIALIALNARIYPAYLELGLLFFQYIQIISQFLLQNNDLYPTNNMNSNGALNHLYFIAKIFNPGRFLQSIEAPNLKWGILAIYIWYLIFRFYLYWHIIRVAMGKTEKKGIVIKILQWIFKLQIHLLFFIMISINCNYIIIAAKSSQHSSEAYIVICAFLIFLEYITTIGQLVRWSSLLPYRGLIASKNHNIEIIIVTQKFILMILQIVLQEKSLTSLWIMIIFNLLSCLAINFVYRQTLPNYKIKTLFIQGHLISIITALNLTYLIRALIISTSDTNFGIDSTLIIWTILTPLILKTNKLWLHKQLTTIVTSSIDKLSVSLLIHKPIIIKEMIKTKRTLDLEHREFDQVYLKYLGIQNNLGRTLNIGKEDLLARNPSVQTKEAAYKAFLVYFETLLIIYPKSGLINIFKAFYCGKKLSLYGRSLKLISRLERLSSTQIKVSVCLLKHEIQRRMSTEQKNGQTSKLDLASYSKSNLVFLDLERKMLKQIDLQVSLFREFNKDTINRDQIFGLALSISSQRMTVEKSLDIIKEILPPYYLKPWFAAQYYYLIVNHSMTEYLKCAKSVFKKLGKYRKKFAESNIEVENIYQNDNILLTLSFQDNATAGTIVYASNSTQQILGRDSQLLIGKNIGSILPTGMDKYWSEEIESYIEHSIGASKSNHGFVLHKSGYMIEVNSCYAIHLMMRNTFCVDLLMRPVHSTTDYLLVKRDGRINFATENISKKLRLLRGKDQTSSGPQIGLNIRDISEELVQLNILLNMRTLFQSSSPHHKSEIIASSPKISIRNLIKPSEFNKMNKINLSYDEAQSPILATALNSWPPEGKVIRLTQYKSMSTSNIKLNNSSKTFSYRCRIDTPFNSQTQDRLFSFDEVKRKTSVIESETQDKLLLKPEPSHNGKGDTNEFNIRGNVKRLTVSYLQQNQSHGTPLSSIHTTTNLFTEPKSPNALSSSHRALFLGEFPSPTSDRKLVLSVSNQPDRGSLFLKSRKHGIFDEEVEQVGNFFCSNTGQRSRISQAEKANKVFNEALEKKYYPRFLNVFLVVFYFAFLALMLKITLLEVVANSKRSQSFSKKNILLNMQMQNFYLVKLQGYAQSIWSLDIARLYGIGDNLYSDTTITKVSSLSLDDTYLSRAAGQISLDLDTLVSNNKNLMQTISLIHGDFEQKIFHADVPIYQTSFYKKKQEYYLLDNFQSIDAIVAAFHSILSTPRTDITLIIPSLLLITRNLLNSILLKSEDITADLKSISEASEKSEQQLNLISLASSLVVFVMILCAILIIILIQYRSQKRNINILSRLNTSEINKALRRLLECKRTIQEELYEQNAYLTNYIDTLMDVRVKREDPNTSKVRNKQVIYKSLNRTYYIYLFKLLFLVLVIFGLFCLVYTIRRDQNIRIHNKFEQLEYLEWATTRTYLSYIAIIELVSGNDTLLIRNQPTSMQLNQSIEEIDLILETFNSDLFREHDHLAYDASVDILIYGKACSYGGEQIISLCDSLQSDAEPINLVSLLNNIRYYIDMHREQYIKSNKTAQALYSTLQSVNTLITPRIIALLTLSNVTITGVSHNFEVMVGDTVICVLLLSIFLLIGTALFGLLVWMTIFKHIREADNELKKVLRAFPPHVILSNIFSREYLKRTSGSIRDNLQDEL